MRETFKSGSVGERRATDASTRKNRPSGIKGGLAETWAMAELGTCRTYRKGACRKHSA
ncbi:MAG: hypothetical protein JRD93_12190 [Deltaproteobacteria bacterium]|nr:hypothetical protein [Deltaproteobacteria bacterium]